MYSKKTWFNKIREAAITDKVPHIASAGVMFQTLGTSFYILLHCADQLKDSPNPIIPLKEQSANKWI